jgi:hypothetical protein
MSGDVNNKALARKQITYICYEKPTAARFGFQLSHRQTVQDSQKGVMNMGGQ